MNKFIDCMGVEIEGGWDEEPQNRQHDGSVEVGRCAIRGESVSRPTADFNKLIRFVRANQPDRVDSTCGLHVHFSFTSIGYYMRLMEKAFQPYFMAGMERWAKAQQLSREHQFWHRLQGRNGYCKKEWHADDQAHQRQKGISRYAVWNFCYSLHGTAECRLLCTFEDAETNIAGIRAIKALVMLWLRKTKEDFGEIIAENLNLNSRELAMDAPSEPETIKETICV